MITRLLSSQIQITIRGITADLINKPTYFSLEFFKNVLFMGCGAALIIMSTQSEKYYSAFIASWVIVVTQTVLKFLYQTIKFYTY